MSDIKPYNGLSFQGLREANAARLPEFKNCNGGPAHSKPDGSDWSPAQWLQAMIGEIGEWAEVRIAYENGSITRDEFVKHSSKEMADIGTYYDIFARRSLDQLASYYTAEGAMIQGSPVETSRAGALMELVAELGDYANNRKKLERGDDSRDDYSLKTLNTENNLHHLVKNLFDPAHTEEMPHPGDEVRGADLLGVVLHDAIIEKFNQVSERVGSDVTLCYGGWCRLKVDA